MIYLDNAATTWPKPDSVVRAICDYLQNVGASPGRSGHRLALEASRLVYSAREELARLFGLRDPLRLVFTSNATEALNLALFGLLQPGDHVVTTSVEHNAVMRPLRYLESTGVRITVVRCSPAGLLDPLDVDRAVQPNTMLIAVNHASNVIGSVLPIAEVASIASRHGCLCLVDAAQTAGVAAIDVDGMGIDLLAFTGHKALFGPQGTGGLCLGQHVNPERLRPLTRGGTGSRSESEEQPSFLPDRFESGTMNATGIAGLLAGVRFVRDLGLERIIDHERAMTTQLFEGLANIPGVRVYGTGDPDQRTGTIAFNILGQDPANVALLLDERYEIMSRPGLHCAPSAHRTIGTFPEGTVRFSLSYLNTHAQVEFAIAAVRELSESLGAHGPTVAFEDKGGHILHENH